MLLLQSAQELQGMCQRYLEGMNHFRFGLRPGFGFGRLAAEASLAPPGPNKPGLKLGLSKSAAPVGIALGVPVRPKLLGNWPEALASGTPSTVPGPGTGWAYSDLR